VTADARAALPAAGSGPTLRSRLIGLGSVFGKTLRDSRRAIALVGLLSGFLMLVSGAGLAAQFGSAASRLELVAQAQLLPVALRGLLGEPIAVETLGGFLSWRIGNTLPAMLGIWSVLALSGTLAGDATRGSLDILVAAPVSRRRIAAQKLLAHVTGIAVAMSFAALITAVTGAAFGTLPGDAIPLGAAAGHFLLTGLLVLFAGAVAFALGPVVGRGRALGLGLVVLFATYLVPAYASVSPVIEVLEPLSPFSWTAGHRPLAGRSDWLPVGALGAVTAGLATLGLFTFERRDLGRAASLGWLRLPSLPAGTRNPFVRQLADRLGAAIGWGLGIGLYGATIAASAAAFSAGMAQLPQIRAMVERIYPGVDITAPSGVLQLAFFPFGSLLAGLGAATFVGGWAGDESNRRLDLVLSTPTGRVPWALASALGVLAAVLAMVALGGAVIGIAVASQGGDAATPLIGLGVLALYGAAVAGVGLAVGGLLRADLAAPVAGGIVIGSYLLELVGTILRAPDWLLQVSLNHHFGQPMAGRFDAGGLALFAVLAVGGVAVGLLGLRRRDLRG